MATSTDSSTDTEANAAGPSKPKKKKMYMQHFKKEWSSLPGFKWVESSKKGSCFAWCPLCITDINISQGKGNLQKHSASAKHRTAIKNVCRGQQQNIATMFVNATKEKTIEVRAKEGVVRTAGFLAEHNLPMSLMNHFIPLISAVCSDSEIAKKMNAGRTKITRVVKKVTGKSQEEFVIDRMKIDKFSIIADESTDASCKKHLCLTVRFNYNKQIKDYFLTLIHVSETSGEVLYTKIIDFLKEKNIPYERNFIGFASDGASNMVGIRNSVVSRLLEHIPGIFTMKCICHSFHLCASYACQKLPEEIEQLTKEIHNYFSNSPKRVDELREFQDFVHVSPAKILHPCQTRWLSLESVVKRLLSQFNALVLFFIDQASQKIEKAISILEGSQKTENRLYLEFLAHALPIFNNLNRLMQSESPKIHILYKEISLVVKRILDFYIKDDVIKSTTISDIVFSNPRNFLDINEMYFSAAINASNLEKNRLQTVKMKCLNFYIESVSQILSRFPLKNSIFEKLDFIDPHIVKSRKIRSLGYVLNKFPKLCNPEDIQDIDNEWLELRNFEINFDSEDPCEFWKKISEIESPDKELRFKKLSNFVFDILTLPHSSACVERIFSIININKSKARNRLNTSTLIGLLHTKDLVSKDGAICADFEITKEMLSKMNQKIYESDSE